MKISSTLPAKLQADTTAAVADWQSNNKVARLWARDASLWTNDDESKWLGWLDIVERQQKDLAQFHALAQDMHQEGFEHVLLLGMGGSSLCPEVLALTFGRQKGFPLLQIVDSTDPAQIRAVEESVDLKKTVVIVSSKSGSTLEPNILKQYFFARMQEAVGPEKAGSHFLAVTDPGSNMEQVAKADNFRKIFYGDPSIGGRYSALSNFGMVPAAVMGLDVKKLLAQAQLAVDACKVANIADNPGVQLGLILGTAANAGRDKITFFTSPKIHDLGAWFEQLIAESTGKQGKGITPVDREHIAAPEYYGNDRIFAHVRLQGDDNADTDAAVLKLAHAGHPVVRIDVPLLYDIGQQFFIWEIATGVAGSVIGINAFNQPDVEASKIETKRLTSEYEKTGKLPEETPILEDDGIRLYAGKNYAPVLQGALAAGKPNLTTYICAHLSQIEAGDYFATLAYIQMDAKHEEALQHLRHQVRNKKHVATCLGFGPRFQHSTGQDYKGGPNTGVFIQVTADHVPDLAIPGQKFTFGIVIAAQAAGDLAVLDQRGRRALRVHLGKDVKGGLKKLCDAIHKALDGD
ncbi:MAG TPA: bifunctional transaldolase/phosoglucose isomerase [Acidobacteriaceae bacterium]|jgi:glucose-6-phosphate isomerase|nr:bifunctional transaldolase/phosoglucose isomerase [Acidobacteriaceae bacterium]